MLKFIELTLRHFEVLPKSNHALNT